MAADARDAFNGAGDILGTAIGETLGYALWSLWPIAVGVVLLVRERRVATASRAAAA